jgi:hypothetical protein
MIAAENVRKAIAGKPAEAYAAVAAGDVVRLAGAIPDGERHRAGWLPDLRRGAAAVPPATTVHQTAGHLREVLALFDEAAG